MKKLKAGYWATQRCGWVRWMDMILLRGLWTGLSNSVTF